MDVGFIFLSAVQVEPENVLPLQSFHDDLFRRNPQALYAAVCCSHHGDGDSDCDIAAHQIIWLLPLDSKETDEPLKGCF